MLGRKCIYEYMNLATSLHMKTLSQHRLVVMRPTMMHQIPFLSEPQPTLDASKVRVCRMNTPVQSHLVRNTKLSAANIASKGLFTRMNSNVRLECRRNSKVTITVRTFQWRGVSL